MRWYVLDIRTGRNLGTVESLSMALALATAETKHGRGCVTIRQVPPLGVVSETAHKTGTPADFTYAIAGVAS